MACFPCGRYNRDCNPQCPFLGLFSQPNQLPHFEAVEFVFGFDKVHRMMLQVPEVYRQDQLRSIVLEAIHRRHGLILGLPGLARRQIRAILNERDEAKRMISQLEQEKSEMLKKISQLQGENAEALGKILVLQRDKEEALLKEKEESERATEEQISQLRHTLKEDFEKYMIRIEHLFHHQATERTARPDEPAHNFLDQEFTGASATEPQVGVEQPRFIWAEQDNEQQPRPPVDLSFSLASFGSPRHGVIEPAVISDHVFSVNPSADEQHPSSSMLRNLDLPPSGKRQKVNSEEEQKGSKRQRVNSEEEQKVNSEEEQKGSKRQRVNREEEQKDLAKDISGDEQ